MKNKSISYMDEQVAQGAEDIPQSPPMGIEDIERLMEEVGPQALTEEEYALVRSKQSSKDFAPGAWNENLCDKLSEQELSLIAQNVWQWVKYDETSRSKWIEREQTGIKMMGITDDVELPDPKLRYTGMSEVVHPGFAEACIQFHARAITELFPPEGPVKAVVLGQSSEEQEEQAERVGSFMNYQYTSLMPGAYDEESRLLLRLPLSGSVFKKVYYDPEEETNMSIQVEPADFIVPYSANDLRTAPRYSHRMWLGEHIIRSRMASGFYRKIHLNFATEANYPDVKRKIEDAEGREPTQFIEDRRHAIYETHAHFYIKSIHAAEGGIGDDDFNVPLPYIVTWDWDTQKVLAIRRNWKKKDPKKKKRIWFVHKKFLPGYGFYGFGFTHVIGGLSRAQTDALRQELNSAAIDNRPGGFIASDTTVALDSQLGIGEWRKVDATWDELNKSFFPLPKNQSTDKLIKLLGYLDDLQRRMASTTEARMGEGNAEAPVGTTLALIEQGEKVATAIHQGLHRANAEEFKLLAELNSEVLPEVYPYRIEGDDKQIFKSDFDDRIDVIPVSDPRLSTNTQKIATAQAVMQLKQQDPDLYDKRNVHKRMLELLRVQGIDELLPSINPVRMDPIEENMAILVKKPIKTFIDQDHEAHQQVLISFFQNLPPELQKSIEAEVISHYAEHEAHKYRLKMQQMMGMQLPYPVIMDGEYEETPKEVEDQISAAAAQVTQLLPSPQNQEMTAQQQALAQQQAIEQQKMQHEQALKEAEMQHEQARKDAEAQSSILRDNALAQAEMEQMSQESEAEKIKQQSKEYE